jgi:DNA-binding transcriptional LysR family regulator
MRETTIRQLEVFCETASCGLLTRAAQKLSLTQSAASMALRQFEKYAGGDVFTRVGRGLRLNDRGERLLPLAREVLGAYDRFAEKCRDAGPLSGAVCVGASTTVADYCLPGAMRGFMAENPGVDISLIVGNTEEMAAALHAGELDFAVVEGEISDNAVSAATWRQDELAIVVPPKHRFASRRRMRIAELENERWILREKGSGTRSTLENLLAQEGIHISDVREIGHTEAIKRAVEAGMGISCLSVLAVSRETKAGTLAAIKLNPPLNRRFTLLQFKNRYMSRQSKALAVWLISRH